MKGKIMTNKQFTEIIKANEIDSTEYLNAVAEFATMHDVDSSAVLKIAEVIKTRKNTAVRVYNKSERNPYKHINVNYDGRGYLGSFRGTVEFNFNDRGECFAIYGM